MKKSAEFDTRHVDNDISMNDFLVNHHDITTICLPASMSVKNGQSIHLENPYRNTKDTFKILSKSHELHGIIEYRAKLL